MSDNLYNYQIDYTLCEKFEQSYLKQEVFIPIKEEELYVSIACLNNTLDESYLAERLNKPIKRYNFSKKQILHALHLFDLKVLLYKISTNSQNEDSQIDIFLIELFKLALELNSSDIHIESEEENFTIRFRVDGILNHILTLPKEFFNTLSSYIKLKSNLDISLKRLPQDASFSIKILDKKYDFRISTMPTIKGESIVIRILENNSENKTLDTLGFDMDTCKLIKTNINQANGLILITGPTGSGKTTTLYSMIKEINNSGKKIITIEDPVEYKIQNIQQISVNNDIGLTFERVLRNILRQDPDVILIGEIRDKESLKIAIQASLTGHLVLATLHTNSALNTINRIFDLDGEPFLLANTLKSIISQRLVRKLCNDCKEYEEKTNSYISIGCEKCNFEGYKGRVVLYELLNIDEKISNMIAVKKTNDEILNYVKTTNYMDIKEYSKRIIKNGDSSIKEVYKVVSL